MLARFTVPTLDGTVQVTALHSGHGSVTSEQTRWLLSPTYGTFSGMWYLGYKYPGIGAIFAFLIGCVFAYEQPPNWIAWMVGAFVLSLLGFLSSYNAHQRNRDTTGLQ